MTSAMTCAADEIALVRRLQQGDERAFTTLYDRHQSRVFSVARRVTADPRMAEDVTQEVFAYLWRNADRVDPERGELRAFLTTVARQRAIDRIRADVSRRRRHERAGRLDASLHHGTADVATGVVAADALQLRQSALHDAIGRLPEVLRTSIQLAYFQGHSYRQVAEVMGIPEGTAKSRLRLAIARLRRDLQSTALVVADIDRVNSDQRAS